MTAMKSIPLTDKDDGAYGIGLVPANEPWPDVDTVLLTFSVSNAIEPEKSWTVWIMADGDVKLAPGFDFTEAAREFWRAVEQMGKSLLRRAEDAEARLRALEGK